MKTLLFSLAAVAALAVTAGPAAAQYPGPGPYGPVVPATYGYGAGYGYGSPGCTQCDGGSGYGGYGLGGFGLKDKLMGGGWLSGKFLGIFHNHGGGGGGPRTLPVVDPRSGNAGQLAFPQNPFVRGPRDYFMLEDR
jgi:hypothetical protein